MTFFYPYKLPQYLWELPSQWLAGFLMTYGVRLSHRFFNIFLRCFYIRDLPQGAGR